MILTRASLDALQVSHKCWSRAQFSLLEVPFPPDKGWLKRLEGKFITPETHQQLQQISQKAKKSVRVTHHAMPLQQPSGKLY